MRASFGSSNGSRLRWLLCLLAVRPVLVRRRRGSPFRSEWASGPPRIFTGPSMRAPRSMLDTKPPPRMTEKNDSGRREVSSDGCRPVARQISARRVPERQRQASVECLRVSRYQRASDVRLRFHARATIPASPVPKGITVAGSGTGGGSAANVYVANTSSGKGRTTILRQLLR
jgi:hypothetical protein